MTDDFSLHSDPQSGFSLIGDGALGGKASGLVFLNDLLRSNVRLPSLFPGVHLSVPDTLVITSSGFDAFVQTNQLGHLARAETTDTAIAESFLDSKMPEAIANALRSYLATAGYPLAVRSSGMLEDAQYHAYAGLYKTYMLSNDQEDIDGRLVNLERAVKLVYASTFFRGPRAYARRVGHPIESGKMAVIVQKVAGRNFDGHYFPAISGVAQSRNYYPFAGMKTEDGLATIAFGLGEQVVSGEQALRFCPKFPKRLPQRSSVEETLSYAQREFYALKMNTRSHLDKDGNDHLVRLQVADVSDRFAEHLLMGTYVLAEHRIRDTVQIEGPRVLTFAGPLKYDLFPLANLVATLLQLGEEAMSVPVEVEFAVNLPETDQAEAQFFILQMRPMTARNSTDAVEVSPDEITGAICYTQHAIGNSDGQSIEDIVYVKPSCFDPAKTRLIVPQVAALNAMLEQQQRQYLLVGPGRWGSADPWLGIPVRWADISNVAAIVETVSPELKAEPSQGAHFFHNIASLGISYLSVSALPPDRIDWRWLTDQTIHLEKDFVAHIRLERPLVIKVDGRSGQGVIFIATGD
jgi:hypothetical protein